MQHGRRVIFQQQARPIRGLQVGKRRVLRNSFKISRRRRDMLLRRVRTGGHGPRGRLVLDALPRNDVPRTAFTPRRREDATGSRRAAARAAAARPWAAAAAASGRGPAASRGGARGRTTRGGPRRRRRRRRPASVDRRPPRRALRRGPAREPTLGRGHTSNSQEGTARVESYRRGHVRKVVREVVVPHRDRRHLRPVQAAALLEHAAADRRRDLRPYLRGNLEICQNFAEMFRKTPASRRAQRTCTLKAWLRPRRGPARRAPSGGLPAGPTTARARPPPPRGAPPATPGWPPPALLDAP